MRRYNERTAELSFGQRFRFTNRHANLRQVCGHVAQEDDAEGRRRFAASFRRGRQSNRSGARPGSGHAGAAAPVPDKAQPRRPAESVIQAAQEREEAASFALSFTNPENERTKIVQLYQKLIEAHNESGESASAPNLQAFERFVRKKTQELKDKGGSEVEYSVTIQEGRVKFKARISA